MDKTVIDRAVRNVYRAYLADPDPAKMPVLGDLYNELLQQPEPEAARIAAALELYVSGSLNVFNHRTNVELSNRLVCFDIKQLGKQLKKLGMLIVQDQVWNRVTVNRAEKKATRYYMDEFHLLLKEEQTAAYSVEIGKDIGNGAAYRPLSRRTSKTSWQAAKWKTSLKTAILSSCSIRRRATGLSLQSSSTFPHSR